MRCLLVIDRWVCVCTQYNNIQLHQYGMRTSMCVFFSPRAVECLFDYCLGRNNFLSTALTASVDEH